jgi:hypothetical protein
LEKRDIVVKWPGMAMPQQKKRWGGGP